MTPAELHAARKRLGMTQAQLADALRLRGRDRTRTVRAWEKGEKPISGPAQVAVELMLYLDACDAARCAREVGEISLLEYQNRLVAARQEYSEGRRQQREAMRVAK